VPDRRPPLFPLRGRSLTFGELGEALLACMDRRIEALEQREPWPDRTDEEIQADLDQEVARIEARRMIERLVAGEPWADIRSSVVGGSRHKG